MFGNSFEIIKESLILIIKSLPENSYFNLLEFGKNVSNGFNKSKFVSD